VLKKKYRLNKSVDIKTVLYRGKYRHYGTVMLVKWILNTMSHHRLTVIVSQKVSKKATIRNKIKRSLLGSVSEELLQSNIGYDIVVVAKNSAKDNLARARRYLIECITKLSIHEDSK